MKTETVGDLLVKCIAKSLNEEKPRTCGGCGWKHEWLDRYPEGSHWYFDCVNPNGEHYGSSYAIDSGTSACSKAVKGYYICRGCQKAYNKHEVKGEDCPSCHKPLEWGMLITTRELLGKM